MQINPIQSLTYSINQLKNQVSSPTVSTGVGPSAPVGGAPQIDQGGGGISAPDFGTQVMDAVKHVNHLQKTADELTTQVASGNPEDAHKAVIAMDHALMAVDFTLQVRNKVLDAYQEIMRTQL